MTSPKDSQKNTNRTQRGYSIPQKNNAGGQLNGQDSGKIFNFPDEGGVIKYENDEIEALTGIDGGQRVLKTPTLGRL